MSISIRVVAIVAAGLIVVGSALADSSPPARILGSWAADCASAERGRNSAAIRFTTALAEITIGERQVCRYAVIRRQHATRWYVDLKCDGGARFDLDINLVGPDRLLVAKRPLGEARWYHRCTVRK